MAQYHNRSRVYDPYTSCGFIIICRLPANNVGRLLLEYWGWFDSLILTFDYRTLHLVYLYILYINITYRSPPYPFPPGSPSYTLQTDSDV